MKTTTIFFTILFLISPLFSKAQESEKDSLININGRIIDKKNKPIIFAHVINVRRGQGSITDTSGYFLVAVEPRDIIRVTAIGYESKFLAINDSVMALDTINIELTPKYYELAEIDIFKIRWIDFKNEFLGIKVPDIPLPERFGGFGFPLFSEAQVEELNFMGPPGIPIFYNDKAKEAKIRLAKIKEIALRDSLVLEKVKTITSFEGEKLYRFIYDLKLTGEMKKRMTEYKIYMHIKHHFERLKQEEKE